MPRKDGPYLVTAANADLSSYTISMPNDPAKFHTFHISELAPFIANDNVLFPGREYPEPGPIVTEDGMTEYFVDKIVDSRRRGNGRQFLVR